MKGWKKIFHANRDQKKAGVAILISDKIDFKTKAVKRDKEGHYIMIKGQQHYQSLEQVLTGKVPSCDCNDSAGKEYMPKNTYEPMSSNEDKRADAYLATDCIGTEKYVSSEYNNNVFAFANTQIRKLLADIQVEEQNHAEMLYKYKTVNGMA